MFFSHQREASLQDVHVWYMMYYIIYCIYIKHLRFHSSSSSICLCFSFVRFGVRWFPQVTANGSWSTFVPQRWVQIARKPKRGGYHPWKLTCNTTGWWFQILFISTPTWGRFPFWLIFFKWVETTNQWRFGRWFSFANGCVFEVLR